MRFVKTHLAILVAGGEGQVEETGVGFKPHLWVTLLGAEVACGGSPAMDRGGGARQRWPSW